MIFICHYKISVIIPIYNQEKHLKNTIESVINQTIDFNEIELILVDDNSTDKSKDIIKKYAKKYPNIKPIFLDENSGNPGIPKNIGIKNASSQFILFLDSDDIFLNDICEVLYNKIIDEGADFVSGNLIDSINGKPYYDLVLDDKRSIIFPKKKYSDFKPFRVVGTLFNKNFILKNNIYFLNEKTNEDTYFSLKSFFKAKKICYLDDYYGMIYYMRGTNSATTMFNKEILISTIHAFSNINNLLKDLGECKVNGCFYYNVLTIY